MTKLSIAYNQAVRECVDALCEINGDVVRHLILESPNSWTERPDLPGKAFYDRVKNIVGVTAEQPDLWFAIACAALNQACTENRFDVVEAEPASLRYSPL